MKLISWNVNGIRAVAQKGFADWLESAAPDVLCLQETKAHPNQLESSLTAPFGYQTYWSSAKKAGYSGVAVYSKHIPKDVIEGLGYPEFDDEGRVLQIEFKNFTLLNAYFPNSQREHTRLPYKLKFCDAMFEHCNKLTKAGKNIVLCGDYNIAHREIDLRNPKTNANNAGFLPQERAWMDQFLSTGYTDTFRAMYPDLPDQYTWWSYMPGVRQRNIGWRIDYFCTNKNFHGEVESAAIHPEILGSDHCPISIDLKIKIQNK